MTRCAVARRGVALRFSVRASPSPHPAGRAPPSTPPSSCCPPLRESWSRRCRRPDAMVRDVVSRVHRPYPISTKEVLVSSSSVRFSLGRIAALLLAGSVALPGALAAQRHGHGAWQGHRDRWRRARRVRSGGRRRHSPRRRHSANRRLRHHRTSHRAQTIRVVRIGYTPSDKQVTVPASGEVRADVSDHAGGDASRRGRDDCDRRPGAADVRQRRRDHLGRFGREGSADHERQRDAAGARRRACRSSRAPGRPASSSSIRIRGTSSLSLTNEPLIVVDGVRFDNQQLPNSGNVSTQRINRLNTLGDEDIESIDIIKGPSAAALYGTAAANGVIVIKTKRGKVGKTQWNVFGEGGIVQQPAKFEPNWTSWGRALNASGQPTGNVIQCRITSLAAKKCMVDSLTNFNPLMNTGDDAVQGSDQRSAVRPSVLRRLRSPSLLHVGRSRVRGRAVRDAGERDPADHGRARRRRRGRSRFTRTSSSRTTSAATSACRSAPTLTADVSTGYTDQTSVHAVRRRFLRRPDVPGDDRARCTRHHGRLSARAAWRRDVDRAGAAGPAAHGQHARSTGRRKSWFQGRAVFGIDQDHSVQLPRAASWRRHARRPRVGPERSGRRQVPRPLQQHEVHGRPWRNRHVAATPEISTRTSVGAQWFKDELYQAQGQGYNLPPGASTPNSAGSQVRAFEFTTENATYGAVRRGAGGLARQAVRHRRRARRQEQRVRPRRRQHGVSARLGVVRDLG